MYPTAPRDDERLLSHRLRVGAAVVRGEPVGLGPHELHRETVGRVERRGKVEQSLDVHHRRLEEEVSRCGEVQSAHDVEAAGKRDGGSVGVIDDGAGPAGDDDASGGVGRQGGVDEGAEGSAGIEGGGDVVGDAGVAREGVVLDAMGGDGLPREEGQEEKEVASE